MEKIKNLTLVGCLIVGFAIVAHAQYGETYMTAGQAQKKFGQASFDAAKFKTGREKTRGEMAADMLIKKTFNGKTLKSVADLLGPPDGYFENKGIPAYLISTTEKDIWQIVFLPDKDWKTVSEVKIHKNCCN